VGDVDSVGHVAAQRSRAEVHGEGTVPSGLSFSSDAPTIAASLFMELAIA
jgi:hypothetical protein